MKFQISLAMVLAIAACTDTTTVTRDADPALLATPTGPNHPPGTCWEKTETPAVVKTVEEDILVQPAQISSTGTIQSPPIYRSKSYPVIVKEREETWFQIVCDADLTPGFVSSVQRALELRGLYKGPISGQMDTATRFAVKRYHFERGIETADPDKLTVEAARQLGLWTTEHPDAT